MASPFFEIRSSEKAGLGVFAISAIPAGTPLLSEPALLHIPLPAARLLDSAIASAFSALPEASQSAILALSNPPLKHSSAISRIYRGNAVSPAANSTAIFPTLARVNHSCVPNASLDFTPATHAATVSSYSNVDTTLPPPPPPHANLFAAQDIAAGDEITFAYLDHIACMPRSYRRFLLQLNWRFDCLCHACAVAGGTEDGGAEAAASDSRRARAYTLLARLTAFGLPAISVRALVARGFEVGDLYGSEPEWDRAIGGVWVPPRVEIAGWAGVEECVGAWAEAGEALEVEGAVGQDVADVWKGLVDFGCRLLEAGMVAPGAFETHEGMKVDLQQCADRGLRAWRRCRPDGHAAVEAWKESMRQWATTQGFALGSTAV